MTPFPAVAYYPPPVPRRPLKQEDEPARMRVTTTSARGSAQMPLVRDTSPTTSSSSSLNINHIDADFPAQKPRSVSMSSSRPNSSVNALVATTANYQNVNQNPTATSPPLQPRRAQLASSTVVQSIPLVARESKNVAFHALFKNLSDSEYLIEDFSCALQKEILVQGRLYIASSHICFNATIFGRWGANVVISLVDIVTVEKKMTAFVFPNAIEITTNTGQRHFFASFIFRELAFNLIISLWCACSPAAAAAAAAGVVLPSSTVDLSLPVNSESRRESDPLISPTTTSSTINQELIITTCEESDSDKSSGSKTSHLHTDHDHVSNSDNDSCIDTSYSGSSSSLCDSYDDSDDKSSDFADETDNSLTQSGLLNTITRHADRIVKLPSQSSLSAYATLPLSISMSNLASTIINKIGETISKPTNETTVAKDQQNSLLSTPSTTTVLNSSDNNDERSKLLTMTPQEAQSPYAYATSIINMPLSRLAFLGISRSISSDSNGVSSNVNTPITTTSNISHTNENSMLNDNKDTPLKPSQPSRLASQLPLSGLSITTSSPPMTPTTASAYATSALASTAASAIVSSLSAFRPRTKTAAAIMSSSSHVQSVTPPGIAGETTKNNNIISPVKNSIEKMNTSIALMSSPLVATSTPPVVSNTRYNQTRIGAFNTISTTTPSLSAIQSTILSDEVIDADQDSDSSGHSFSRKEDENDMNTGTIKQRHPKQPLSKRALLLGGRTTSTSHKIGGANIDSDQIAFTSLALPQKSVSESTLHLSFPAGMNSITEPRHPSSSTSTLPPSLSVSPPPPKCVSCSDHLANVVFDAVIPLALHQVYERLYSNESIKPRASDVIAEAGQGFLYDIHKELGEWEFECSDWRSAVAESANRIAAAAGDSAVAATLTDGLVGLQVRTLRYIMPMKPIPMAPKFTRVVTTERILEQQATKVTVFSSTMTPDVVSGTSFTSQARVCITASTPHAQQCRVLVTVGVSWSKSSWIKSVIESSVVDGQKRYWIDVERALVGAAATLATVDRGLSPSKIDNDKTIHTTKVSSTHTVHTPSSSPSKRPSDQHLIKKKKKQHRSHSKKQSLRKSYNKVDTTDERQAIDSTLSSKMSSKLLNTFRGPSGSTVTADSHTLSTNKRKRHAKRGRSVYIPQWLVISLLLFNMFTIFQIFRLRRDMFRVSWHLVSSTKSTSINQVASSEPLVHHPHEHSSHFNPNDNSHHHNVHSGPVAVYLGQLMTSLVEVEMLDQKVQSNVQAHSSQHTTTKTADFTRSTTVPILMHKSDL